MPKVWDGREGLATGKPTAGVRLLRASNHRHRGHCFLGHAKAADGLVPCHVVCDESEERCQRFGAETSVEAEELSDGMGVAS